MKITPIVPDHVGANVLVIQYKIKLTDGYSHTAVLSSLLFLLMKNYRLLHSGPSGYQNSSFFLHQHLKLVSVQSRER